MKWNDMDYEDLRIVLQTAILNGDHVLRTVVKPGEKAIHAALSALSKTEERVWKSLHETSLTIDRDIVAGEVYNLYAAYRRLLNTLVELTQMPDSIELLLDEREARENTIEFLDQDTDGIFLCGDGDCLRLRTPVLPHRSKPVYYISGAYGRYPVTTTRIYGEAVLRTMESSEPELGELYDSLGRKTIHVLNVFGRGGNPTDNDNRDTGAIINSICAFLPGGDAPDVTRIINDGCRTTELIPGTYITVLPYEKGLADNAETIAFWRKRLAAENFRGDTL